MRLSEQIARLERVTDRSGVMLSMGLAPSVVPSCYPGVPRRREVRCR